MRLKKVVLSAGLVVGVFGMGGVVFGENAATQGAATQPGAYWPAPENKPYSREPKSKKEILEISADLAREELMTMLAGGDQPGVEAFLPEVVKKHPEDQGLAFFEAVLTRSRFEVDKAMPQFKAVVAMGANTPEGECAALMVKIDQGEERLASFNRMLEILNAHHEDMLIEWTAAIACRALNQNITGCKIYKFIFAVFYPWPGPVLMHQTYANLLDATGDHHLALYHRRVAVKMEPGAGWSHQGLANTLSSLARYSDAEAEYAKAVELSPSEGLYWQTWGHCLLKQGKYEEAEKKFEKAVGLDLRDVIALQQWGQALEGEKNLDQALAKYQRMIEVAPGNKAGYAESARVLRLLGRDEEADEVMAEWDGRGKKRGV